MYTEKWNREKQVFLLKGSELLLTQTITTALEL
jgi:hypothetical protein